MAAFYPSSTNHRVDMTNLYLRDSGQTLYPESSVGGNMLYFNFASSGPYSELLASNNESQSNCNELPVMSGHTYNEMLFMQPNNGSMDGDNELVRNSVILNGQTLSLQQSNFSTVQGQGLSLSLGTQIPMSSFRYPPSNSDISMNGELCRDDNSRNRILHANASHYGLTNLASNISNSKYLNAAQNLLDEVVNVQKALNQKASKSQSFNNSAGCKDNDGVLKSDGLPSNPQELTANSSTELSPSERQDLQNKVTKLLAMLDEVDRRYKQYYHQMQILVSSFDAITGPGAAKPYTALALQTISQHFRCLRDAINSQIQSTRKILGEQESSSTKGCGISRLRYIDKHLRQQRAMQQLGMMQPHTWRPQRGLPETSVSVLRAWLFEHFLHPYPNDSEKLMLAKQTGLTRGQISNWFINARVRLWKPMVEEMYKEEFGKTEMDSNSSSENDVPKGRDETRSSEDREDLLQSPSQDHFTDSSKSNLIPNMVKFGGSTFHNEAIANNEAYRALHDGERFMAYNTLGLTLGLQHGDSASDGQQGFLQVRGEDIYSTQGPSTLGFGPSHLLHDFVA